VISKFLSGLGVDSKFMLLPDDTSFGADGADSTRVVPRVPDLAVGGYRSVTHRGTVSTICRPMLTNPSHLTKNRLYGQMMFSFNR